MDHLVTTAHAGTAQDAAAAILPCSWGYAEIGRTLSDLGPPESQPLYGRWIEMYADPEFAALAEWLRSYLDRSAEGGEAPVGVMRYSVLEQKWTDPPQYTVHGVAWSNFATM